VTVSRLWGKGTKRVSRLIVAIAAISLLVLLLLFLTLPYWYWPVVRMWHNPFRTDRFDRAKWMAAAPTTEQWREGRGPMAEDLRRHFLHRGMSGSDVRRLLGPPNSGGCQQKPGEDWYYLGVWGDWSFDGDYLIIHYDRLGRVTSTEIYEH
jgi:hypothetical protein